MKPRAYSLELKVSLSLFIYLFFVKKSDEGAVLRLWVK